MNQDRRIQIKLMYAYGFFYLGYMVFFPFQTIYLSAVGFDKNAVAVLTTCTAVGNFLIQFPMGRLSGTAISTKKLILLLLMLAIPLGFAPAVFHGTFGVVVLSMIPISLVDFSLIAQLDSYVLAQADRQYSTVRTIGSLAGAAASLLCGKAYTHWGTEKMFWLHGLFMGICLLCFLRLPEHSDRIVQKQHGDGSVRAFLPLFFGGGLLFLAWRVILIYLPIRLLELGGDASHQGMAMAIMNISIMPVLALYTKLRKRFCCRRLLSMGSASMAVRLVIMACSENIWILTFAQVLEAVSYGVVLPTMMELFGRASSELRPRVVSIWTGIQMALSTILANGLVTLLSKWLDMNVIFAWMILPVILGWAVMLHSNCTKEECSNAG